MALVVVSLLLLGGMGCYVLAIRPSGRNRMKHSVWRIPYAHRGLHGRFFGIPENSLPAFGLAAQRDFGIELDVRLSRDNVPVVFHDADLKRLCGENLAVAQLTAAELRRYTLLESDERIPTLGDVLELVNGSVPLIVELKGTSRIFTLCRAAACLFDHYDGLFCVESFHPLILLWFRLRRPRVLRGQLAQSFTRGRAWPGRLLRFVCQPLVCNWLTCPDFLAYRISDKRDVSFRLCRRLYGVTAFAWTIRNPEMLSQLASDFDSYLFEDFIPNEPVFLFDKRQGTCYSVPDNL